MRPAGRSFRQSEVSPADLPEKYGNNEGMRRFDPTTAVDLMRSRFEAFRRADAEWLLRTWHSSTRPKVINLDGNPTWRGLQIVEVIAGEASDDAGIVEFRATYLNNDGSIGILRERSRFVKEAGHWYYVDGEFPR